MSENIEVVLIDIGNTRIKTAEVTNGKIGELQYWDKIEQIAVAYNSDQHFMVCSTRAEPLQLKNVHYLDHASPLPIELDYHTPKTLGPDRIAAAVGALELFPTTTTLIIDIGTCMTMDLITKEGIFKGGVISPGLKMRMKSMAQFTGRLPDISEKWSQLSYNLLGKSTDECLLSGSYGGMVSEIKQAYQQLSEDFTSINVILTGGDADHFESIVKAHIFAGSKIVLTGLYRIWKSI